MALGGGIFTNTKKTLPGAYINIVSASRSAGVVGERGVVAFAYPLAWNKQSAVIEVTAEDFYGNCLEIFGYNVEDDEMIMFREVFKHAHKIYVYNLNADGIKATNASYATAKYEGVVGNKIRIAIVPTTRITNGYDVKTYCGNTIVDTQLVVAESGVLTGLEDNAYVTWATNVSAPDDETEVTLTGGSNGSETTDHTSAIAALSRKSFNVLCAYTAEATNIERYTTACRTARDDSGVNYQVVVYNKAGENYEGIVNLCNAVTPTDKVPAHGLLLWTAGAMASCPLNTSLTNFTYDGELAVNVDYSQDELEAKIVNGVFAFHEVGNEVRVLDDINSYVSDTSEKARDIFGFNQSIRIIDQSVNDIASLFNNKYNGKIQNDDAGRVALWSDLVSYYQELERIRAIESFAPDTDLTVSAVSGNRRAVTVKANITIINTMTQLYMTVLVK
jgi:hypothetical protein